MFRKESRFESELGYVKNLLVKVLTRKNIKLNDDAFVEECMDALKEQHPSIGGYTYERVGHDAIQILMWFKDSGG